MKLLSWGKDGGPESRVWGFWLCEFKSLFSIVLLKFEDGTREMFHDHAFNAVSWVLRGRLKEYDWFHDVVTEYPPAWRPVVTLRSTMHMVRSYGTTWVLSIRGPWSKTWHEMDPIRQTLTILTHGRKEV